MLDNERITRLKAEGRFRDNAARNDADLGGLAGLTGEWRNVPHLAGHGWNLIAVPHSTDHAPGLNYRLFLSRYNERLAFRIADKAVINRGLCQPNGRRAINLSQLLVALDYEQSISQVEGKDYPSTREIPPPGRLIHHEAGLWLHMSNHESNHLDLARLATTPHGSTVLALGNVRAEYSGEPRIEDIPSAPVGGPTGRSDPYFAPYRHFHANPLGDRFDPLQPANALRRANRRLEFIHTTELHVSTEYPDSAIVNIPFLARHAKASAMHSTIWLSEYQVPGEPQRRRHRLQYLQAVTLEFFERSDGSGRLMQWPHISINTMEPAVEA